MAPAARAPNQRRDAIAMRWRQCHPCPRHHNEHSGQDQGTGAEPGPLGKITTRSPCPLRALRARRCVARRRELLHSGKATERAAAGARRHGGRHRRHRRQNLGDLEVAQVIHEARAAPRSCSPTTRTATPATASTWSIYAHSPRPRPQDHRGRPTWKGTDIYRPPY